MPFPTPGLDVPNACLPSLAQPAALRRQIALWNVYQVGTLHEQWQALDGLKYLYIRCLRSGGRDALNWLETIRARHIAGTRFADFPEMISQREGHAFLDIPRELPLPAYLDVSKTHFDFLPEIIYLGRSPLSHMGFQGYFLIGALQTFQDIVTDKGVEGYAARLRESRRFPKPVKIKKMQRGRETVWWLDDGYHRATAVSRRPQQTGFHRFIWGQFAGTQSRPPGHAVPLETIRVVTEEEYARRAEREARAAMAPMDDAADFRSI